MSQPSWPLESLWQGLEGLLEKELAVWWGRPWTQHQTSLGLVALRGEGASRSLPQEEQPLPEFGAEKGLRREAGRLQGPWGSSSAVALGSPLEGVPVLLS